MKYTTHNTTCATWFERDRAHVALRDENDRDVFELWDEDVGQFVEDGFKSNRQSWHEAMVEYANAHGLRPKKLKGGMNLMAEITSMENRIARKFDLGAGHLGNGVTVWNRAKEVGGDYETVAHIDRDRTISWHIKNPPKEVVDYVERIAKGPNMSSSTSHPDNKVFSK